MDWDVAVEYRTRGGRPNGHSNLDKIPEAAAQNLSRGDPIEVLGKPHRVVAVKPDQRRVVVQPATVQ